MIEANLNSLKRLGKYWQRKLGLLDWTINFVFDELPENGQGSCTWDAHIQEATVRISPTLAIAKYSDGGIEATLIHELVHIVLQGHQSEEEIEEPLATIIEISINRLADALCRTKVRRGKKRQ
jgi:hypothetical protein